MFSFPTQHYQQHTQGDFMKTALSLFALIALISTNALASGPLGGGTFQGGANWSCSTEPGFRCVGVTERRYTATSKISDSAYEWSAADMSGEVVWSYVMDLRQTSQSEGKTVYAASIKGEALGDLVCEGNECLIKGADSCETGRLCGWAIQFEKKESGEVRIYTRGDYHFMLMDNRGGRMGTRRVTAFSRTTGYMQPAKSDVTVPQTGGYSHFVHPIEVRR